MKKTKLAKNVICCLIKELLPKRFELSDPALFCNISTTIGTIRYGAAHFTKYHVQPYFLKENLSTHCNLSL